MHSNLLYYPVIITDYLSISISIILKEKFIEIILKEKYILSPNKQKLNLFIIPHVL